MMFAGAVNYGKGFAVLQLRQCEAHTFVLAEHTTGMITSLPQVAGA